MSDRFTHGEFVKCPGCGHNLSCIERNYSGCSVDNAVCEKCGKGWQISFKVNEIRREPEYDDESEERRKERVAKEREDSNKQIIREEKDILKRLKEKYES